MNFPSCRRIELTKTLYQSHRRIALREIENIPETLLESWIDESIRCMVFELKAFVWSEKLGVHEIQYPAGWWQMFKAEWFPAWARKRWPVKMKTIRLEAKALYPSYKHAVPDHRPNLTLMVME